MKCSLLLSLILCCWIVRGVCGTTSNHVLETFDTVNIAEEMLIGTGDTGLPESLHGLWWMDGNTAPEEVVSLGGSVWDPASRTIVVSPTDEGVWAYNDNDFGRFEYGFLLAFPALVGLAFQFNENLTEADISVNLKVLWFTIKMPRWFVSFTMKFVEDGVWERDSGIVFFAPVDSYTFRRIVTVDGEPTASFDDFVASTPATLFVARRPR